MTETIAWVIYYPGITTFLLNKGKDYIHFLLHYRLHNQRKLEDQLVFKTTETFFINDVSA